MATRTLTPIASLVEDEQPMRPVPSYSGTIGDPSLPALFELYARRHAQLEQAAGDDDDTEEAPPADTAAQPKPWQPRWITG